MSDTPADPVVARRRRIGRLAANARRAGWALYAVAVVAFVAGVVAGPSGATVAVVIGALVLGSMLLLPAIVIGFGVSAADRDERRS
ncbi:MAG TPA: hypothetical protein VI854_00955 [Acidimicrobiia bacterium]|nr:hypothetical protein [Acidimicrobiia bacterium]